MTGFELLTSGVGSDCPTNRATTTALIHKECLSHSSYLSNTIVFKVMNSGYDEDINLAIVTDKSNLIIPKKNGTKKKERKKERKKKERKKERKQSTL